MARRAPSPLTFAAAIPRNKSPPPSRAAAASTWARVHSSPGAGLLLQPPAQPRGRSRGQGRPAPSRAPLTSDKAQSTFLARCQDTVAHSRTVYLSGTCPGHRGGSAQRGSGHAGRGKWPPQREAVLGLLAGNSSSYLAPYLPGYKCQVLVTT